MCAVSMEYFSEVDIAEDIDNTFPIWLECKRLETGSKEVTGQAGCKVQQGRQVQV